MRGQKRDSVGDRGRTGVIEGWKLHERSTVWASGVDYSVDRVIDHDGVRGAVQSAEKGGNSVISVALAPRPVNDSLRDAKAFGFC
jgi:hypothetical protein